MPHHDRFFAPTPTGQLTGFGNPPIEGIETPLREMGSGGSPVVRFEALLPVRTFDRNASFFGGGSFRGTAGTGAPRGGGSAQAPRNLPREGVASPTFMGGMSRFRVTEPEDQANLSRSGRAFGATGARAAGPRGDQLEVDFARRPMGRSVQQREAAAQAVDTSMRQASARMAPREAPPADTRPPPSGGVLIGMGRAARAGMQPEARMVERGVSAVGDAVRSIGGRSMAPEPRSAPQYRPRTQAEQREMLDAEMRAANRARTNPPREPGQQTRVQSENPTERVMFDRADAVIRRRLGPTIRNR